MSWILAVGCLDEGKNDNRKSFAPPILIFQLAIHLLLFAFSPISIPPGDLPIMQAPPITISDESLAAMQNTLAATYSPNAEQRKAAEEALKNGVYSPNFLLLVLELVRSDKADMAVRQAAGVFFKNTVRQHWNPEEAVSDYYPGTRSCSPSPPSLCLLQDP